MKKTLSILTIISFIILCLTSCIIKDENVRDLKQNNETEAINPEEEKYKEALELIDKGNYEEAYEALEALGDYKDAEEMLSRFHYVYDKGEISVNGVIETSSIITHNEDNLPVRQVSTTSNDVTTYDYLYDDKGNMIKEVITTSDGSKIVCDKSYDENGNEIKEVTTNPDGTKTVKDYTYDEKNNLIKEVETDFNGEKLINEYNYDENGNIIKKVYTDSDGKITSYDYTCKFVYIPYDVTDVFAEAKTEA